MAERDIPEEMVEKAIARVAHEVYEAWRVTANRDAHVGDAIRAAASQAVSAALAGRQVVVLPKPDLTDSEGDPAWTVPGVHVDTEDHIVAYVYEGRPLVSAITAPDDPIAAEAYALALLAAAREARRLAAGSGSGED